MPVKDAKLILASASPRRRTILEQLKISFETVVTDVEEKYIKGEAPYEHVIRLSKEKAVRGCELYQKKNYKKPVKQNETIVNSFFFIGADTVVVLDKKILGKPENEQDARKLLSIISGKTHLVYTGITLLSDSDGYIDSRYEKTEVEIRKLSSGEITGYVRTKEPMDKAGAYAVQGLGAGLVRRIHGCFYNVVGLPVGLLLDMFKDAGVTSHTQFLLHKEVGVR